MVTIRKLFSILLTMGILMFMFQASQVIKEKGSHYDINEYAEIKLPKKRTEAAGNGKMIVLCGDAGTPLAKMAEEWCVYTKRELVFWDKARKEAIFELSPEFVLVDSSTVDFQMDTIVLQKMVRKGVPIIFGNLPDSSEIAKNAQLAEMLGIRRIRQKMVEIEGIHLFSDFLLGGEAVYRVEDPERADEQDFVLSVPWYDIRLGSKAYMVGMMDAEKITYQDFPPLIWRNYCKGVMVFAVNGDFCEGLTGFGILDAMCYEMNEYVLYPVVNAQNVLLTEYPLFTDENTEGLRKLYERKAEALQRDIMWPSILSLATKERLKLTTFFSPRLSYGEDGEPSGRMVPFYLQQLKEISSETGRSFHYSAGTTPEGKLASDNEFYKKYMERYRFCAGYARTMEEFPQEVLEGKGENALSTLICEDRGELPLLSYLTDSVTLLGVTENGSHYTFRADLRARSIATSLAFANTSVSMLPVLWPQEEKEYWEHYSIHTFSYMSTYWTRFKFIERTTATESDYRVRNFLNFNYTEKRQGNKILLTLNGENADVWFLFRAHEKNISGMENGTYKKIEENTYLIHVTASEAVLELSLSEDNLHYTGPVFE